MYCPVKKVTLLILVVHLVVLSGYAQIKGIDLRQAKVLKSKSGTFKNYEDLLQYHGAYCITYPLAPIGLQHCMDKLKKLMTENMLVWSHTRVDQSKLASTINGDLTDYAALHSSIQDYKSQVIKTWELQNGWFISLNLTANAYTIWFIPADAKPNGK
jgi:hypothetical protein